MWGYVAIVVAYLLLAVPSVVIGIQHALANARQRRWRPVEADVLSSATVKVASADSIAFKPAIRYTYAVDGTTHESDRFGAIDGGFILSDPVSGEPVAVTHDKQWVDAVVAHLQPGARIRCLVDPTDPTRAVLHQSYDWSPWWLIGWPVVGLAMITYWLIVGAI